MALRAVALLSGLLWILPGAATAYTGGPVRVQLAGYDQERHRVYFRLAAHDESGTPPQAWYFDLDADDPSLARRDRVVEPRDTVTGEWDLPGWRSFQKRLVPLQAEPRYSMGLDVQAESTGVDPWHEVTAFTLRIALVENDRRLELELRAWCQPTVSLKGLWSIPGRPERLIVLTTTGRAYGCEDVERPILLP